MSTVLISGANRGLGLEFVRQYAEAGDRVIAAARDPSRAGELKALAACHPDRIAVHPLDVAYPASVEAFKKAVGDTPLDIVIANAGVYGSERQHRLGDIDYDAWLWTFTVNTLGPVRLAEALIENLRAGHDRKLIAITSTLGSIAENSGRLFAYRSSKAALNSAWKGLSAVLKDEGITCVVMHPGWVKTDMGGPEAQVEPKDSIAGMRRVVAGLTLKDTGSFRRFDGGEAQW